MAYVYNPFTGKLDVKGAADTINITNEAASTWTRFYFDRVGATPTAPIADSQNVGKNFGSWIESTAANTATTGSTPTNATYDPTLSGVTVNANGEFQFVAGVYQINITLTFRISNSGGVSIKKNHYLYGESGSDWAGSYDHHLVVVDTANFSDLDHIVSAGGIFVFENATQASNIVYLQMGTSNSPVEPNYYPDYGFLDIVKF